MKKKISAALHFVLLRLSWFIVRILVSTYKVEHDERNKTILQSANGSFIFAMWHEYGLGFLFGHAWRTSYMALASRSKDGDYAAFICQKLGMIPVRGSSRKKGVDKGGQEAIEIYIDQLGKGVSGGITVDGPKGPRHVCKIGIAKIAATSGRPIIPGTYKGSSVWEFNSWDRFKIPKPFSTIRVIYGDPIWVKADSTPEELARTSHEVEMALQKLQS